MCSERMFSHKMTGSTGDQYHNDDLFLSGVDVKLKIRHKLFLTLLLTSTVTAGGLFILLQWSFDRGFLNYVEGQEIAQLDQLAAQLVSYYEKQGDWEFIVRNHPLWRHLHVTTFADTAARRPGPSRVERKQPPDFVPPAIGPRALGPRIVLYDAKKQKIIGGPEQFTDQIPLRPITNQNDVIGYLGLIPVTELSNRGDLLFVEQQKEAFGLVTLIMIGVSMLLTFPVTIHILRPIKELAGGTRKLIGGQFKTRVPVSTGDELGQLSEDFNIMAMTLEENERARKQWVADISHELRTPLAILQGDVEALQDGIRKPGPETFDPLHSEILHLERLVNDLYELSMSDIGALTYKKIEVDPVGILEETAELFENRFGEKGLTLRMEPPTDFSRFLLGDPDRLQQLFTNLLENSLRYTDAPGGLEVSAEQDKENILIRFKDSAPGVGPEQLAKLFDRLFRVDPSRKRGKNGAGLGLTICKNIVEAHQGSIVAQHSPLGGIEFSIKFPLSS